MNTNFRTIRSVLAPPHFHMVGDGFRVHNFFPSQPEIGMKGMSPFFLLDYGSKWTVPPSERQRGVGVHPHRGFETVTIAYHGRVAHHDSAGNSGVIGEGDVQWMTAGAGVLHKEYHEKQFSLQGGIFQMVQLWVNLPSEYKMTPAHYQAIENRDMGVYSLDEKGSTVEVIAGSYKGTTGPAGTYSPLSLFNARLEAGGRADINLERSHNTGILVIEGEVKVNDITTAAEDYFVFFGNDGDGISLEALRKSIVLVLSGEPINEPIASHGPFVMNTQAEINQAYNDFYEGKFGYLED